MSMLKMIHTLRRSQRARRGMTLIEIIVVITIISLLMAAVGVAAIGQLNGAKVDVARNDLRSIENALDVYYAKKGNYPDTGTGLRALVESKVLKTAPVDPWSHEYVYMLEGGKPVIITYGADGTPGGSDLDTDLSTKDAVVKK